MSTSAGTRSDGTNSSSSPPPAPAKNSTPSPPPSVNGTTTNEAHIKGTSPSKSRLITDSSPPPSIPPKDLPSKPTTTQYAPRTSSKSAMPGVSATAATIQRIAEQGAPPLKLSTSTLTTGAAKEKHIAPSPGTARTPSKSPDSNAKVPVTRKLVSPAAKDDIPALPPRPTTAPRSSSHEKEKGQDKNFLKKIKKGREQIHADGLKAASFLNKVSHQTWGKLNQRLAPKSGGHGRAASPQHGKAEVQRDTSNDVDVFGMDLKESVEKTRVVKTRKNGGDAAYWMPAIAYRSLQYLNVYGPHELGIYRISGSTSVVDELRAAFKIQHDVDLFENPPDDLHTVSSMLKGWFRQLPDAVLPLDVQQRIYDKCKDHTDDSRPPQAFIDELSNLPPYNYYLLHHLFSHLSTICLASDVNKMNLANLGMIFCSTLRIDRFCFNWLVNSWADCWAGCNTEEEEYERITNALQRQPSTSTSDSRSVYSVDRGAASSSTRNLHNPSPLARSSSRARSDHHVEREREKEREKVLPTSVKARENGDERTMSMVVETNASPRIGHRNSVDGGALHKQKQTVLLVRPEPSE